MKDPIIKDMSVKDESGHERHVRMVQLEDDFTPEGDTRYTTFARFHTDGSVDIVTTTYTFNSTSAATAVTQAVNLGDGELDLLFKAWQSWEPFNE
ncbi:MULTISPECIES: hypothetical protein [Ktedonobacter]|jgi:hypothetical protein|uniref:Uncharacterized protein n=1 Tax=Ktedonobacter racemifer DSM 44963 TaxID=485913 RepID=D6U3N3_KTERA|nr:MULTISPECIES: hypothetical protein [Ktedonobacter]EFH83023.1 hypothetical protein Krac_3934 [Ktedonobacter racemifer DSM 44963]GHO63875.1 hypothetical protein KSC_027670 [Ktedonobacter sp. SOSP1-52]